MENNLSQNNHITQIGEKQKNELVAVKTEFNSFSGPLPHPDILARYDEIVPGAADRIIKMAEEQSKHRRDLEKKVIESDINNSKLGLVFGFVIGLAAFYLSYQMAKLNQPWLAGVLGLGYVASLVGTFIYGSQNRKRELKDKKEEE